MSEFFNKKIQWQGEKLKKDTPQQNTPDEVDKKESESAPLDSEKKFRQKPT